METRKIRVILIHSFMHGCVTAITAVSTYVYMLIIVCSMNCVPTQMKVKMRKPVTFSFHTNRAEGNISLVIKLLNGIQWLFIMWRKLADVEQVFGTMPTE